ncbi:hypothetical protein pb186bvf_011131 [Paramecium bursaria]
MILLFEQKKQQKKMDRSTGVKYIYIRQPRVQSQSHRLQFLVFITKYILFFIILNLWSDRSERFQSYQKIIDYKSSHVKILKQSFLFFIVMRALLYNLIKSQQTNNFRDLGDLLSSLLIKSSKYDHHIQIVLNKCQSLCRISTNTMTGAANNLITIINISFFQFYLSDKCLILIIENLILVIVSSLISCMYRLAIRSRTDNIPHNQIFQLFKQYLSETELRSTSLQMTQSRGVIYLKRKEFSEMGNCF